VPSTVEPTALPEVRLVRPRLFADERGWFTEVVREDQLGELGIGGPFVQVNQSRSVRGVVRGLHFQWDRPMGKLMRVVAGRAFLVAVDIRPGSPTLGRSVSIEATADEPVLLWAPPWYARGFCALSEVAEIEYFCTATYNAAGESGIRWDDPVLGIPWPVAEPTLSPKDAVAGTLADWLARPESRAFEVLAGS